MIRLTPRSTRPNTLVAYPTLFRSCTKRSVRWLRGAIGIGSRIEDHRFVADVRQMQFTGKKNHALSSGVPVMWRDGVRWELDHHISLALFQVSVHNRKLTWIVDIPCPSRILGVVLRECAPTAHEAEQRL